MVPNPYAILKHFSSIRDPRRPNNLHSFNELLIIALCAIICGADSWVGVAEFGKSKEAWLRTFLNLEHGIPSHDTFGRIFRRLDLEQFGRCFASWSVGLSEATAGRLVPIDGKCLRKSFDRAAGKAAIHMVSAWAAENEVVLACVAVDEKSNEITAIPRLLRLLDLHGCIVTIDAMGCQRRGNTMNRACILILGNTGAGGCRSRTPASGSRSRPSRPCSTPSCRPTPRPPVGSEARGWGWRS
jgi:hypothetical protein